MNTFWNDEIQKKIENIRECKAILEDCKIRELVPNLLRQKIDQFLEKAETAEFQIAFVGTIKAGKSSLINALLNGNYASTNVAPETAVLTKFGDSRDENYYLDVKYYSKNEWEEIWNEVRTAKNSSDPQKRDRIRPFVREYTRLAADKVKNKYLGKAKEHLSCDSREQLSDLIAKYTSASSQRHYFVKEVFVGIKNSGLPDKVVLCDTPGLDDVLDYRSNVTKRYINQANAVLVCVLSRFLASEQLHTIMEVFSLNRFHPERVFVIGTQIDLLAKPMEDWKIQKDEWVKHLSGTECYNSKRLAERNTIGVSAWIEHLISENERKEFNPSSAEYWTLGAFASKCKINPAEMKKHVKELHKVACVQPLMNILKNRIISIYKEALEQEFYDQYKLLRSEIGQKMEVILKENRSLRENLLIESDKIKELLSQAKENKESVKVSEQEFEKINLELGERRKAISRNIEHALQPFLE